MMCNTGKTDRIIRGVFGLGVVAFGLISGLYLVAAFGLVPLLTGVVGFCPLYALFGLDTGCQRGEDNV